MNARPLRILVADRDPLVRSALERVVRAHGFLFEGIEDGRTCMQKVEKRGYDILFVDPFMPDVDAPALLSYMHVHAPVTSVILVSELDDPDTIHALLKSGARAFLIKPLHEATLSDVISRIAAGTLSQDLTPHTRPTPPADAAS